MSHCVVFAACFNFNSCPPWEAIVAVVSKDMAVKSRVEYL